jgi:hypothetical protein
VLRWLPLVFTTVLVQVAHPITAQQAATGVGLLQRLYTGGAVSHYLVTGNNDGWQYTILASDVVKQDSNGRYYEEIRWSDLKSNAQQTLTPSSLALRQTLSLDDPASYMKVPNLATVQPLLIGPITDTLTIYSDLLLAMQSKLVQPGQTAYVSRTTPNSWADGQRVLLGQDVVDFSLKVESVNPVEHTETLLVQHVPPPGFMFSYLRSGCKSQHRLSPTTSSRFQDRVTDSPQRRARRRLRFDWSWTPAMAGYFRRPCTILFHSRLVHAQTGK